MDGSRLGDEQGREPGELVAAPISELLRALLAELDAPREPCRVHAGPRELQRRRPGLDAHDVELRPGARHRDREGGGARADVEEAPPGRGEPRGELVEARRDHALDHAGQARRHVAGVLDQRRLRRRPAALRRCAALETAVAARVHADLCQHGAQLRARQLLDGVADAERVEHPAHRLAEARCEPPWRGRRRRPRARRAPPPTCSARSAARAARWRERRSKSGAPLAAARASRRSSLVPAALEVGLLGVGRGAPEQRVAVWEALEAPHDVAVVLGVLEMRRPEAPGQLDAALLVRERLGVAEGQDHERLQLGRDCAIEAARDGSRGHARAAASVAYMPAPPRKALRGY